jgi:hypothetical protein
MDWDGGRGHNTCLNFTKVYGLGGRVIYEVDLSDAPKGDVIPWNSHWLYHFWCNVDIVGDYREDILVQMPDGSVRAYVNTQAPPARRRCKWQNRTYRTLHAPGDYRYFIAALNEPAGKPVADPLPLVYAGRNQKIAAGAKATLDATVHDGRHLRAEEGLQVKWAKLVGPGDVTFADPTAVDTTASFSKPGTYVLRLTVANAKGQTGDDVAVVVGNSN